MLHTAVHTAVLVTQQHLVPYRLLVSDGLKSTDLTLEQLHRIAAHGAYAVRNTATQRPSRPTPLQIAWFRVLPRAELATIITGHNLPIDHKTRDLPTLLHKELAKDKYRFPPLPVSPRAAPLAKQRSTGAAATAAQRVATATATFVRTHLATQPQAVAEVVAQLSAKLSLDPGSLSPRAVENALQRTPRAAAAALM